MKLLIVAILIPFLLNSCISIRQDAGITGHPQNFVTATLIITKAPLVPAPFLTAPPVPAATSTAAVAIQTNCMDGAILLRDVTIPDDTRVDAGEKFTKTWELQNTGTCSWMGYTIQFSSGDRMNAPLSTPIPDVAPSEKVQVSMELTAPVTDGRYAGYFTLHNSNGDAISIGTQKTFWVKFMVGSYAVAPVVSGANPVQSGNCTHSQNANYVNEIVSLINAARSEAGLPALTVNAQLFAFAQSHAEDMAFNNFLSHDGSTASFSERMRSYGVFGEILAIGTPQNAIDQWRRDEHWDFVLGGGTQIGVGYAFNSCSDYGGYFTVDFQ